MASREDAFTGGMPLEDGRMLPVVLGSAQERSIVIFDTRTKPSI